MFEPRRYGKVAETATGPNSTEIAGLVRGCIKTVVSGTTQQACCSDPIHTKVGYVLGLRVSPSHRYVYVLLPASPTRKKRTYILRLLALHTCRHCLYTDDFPSDNNVVFKNPDSISACCLLQEEGDREEAG